MPISRLWLIMLALVVNSVQAEDVDYARDLKPLLKKHCYACHGALRQKGGLRTDTAVFLRKGGDGGTAVAPGKSADSLLIHALTGANDASQMPEDSDPLTPAQIALFRGWIDQGAKAPQDEPIPPDPRDHWSFRTPLRPAVPNIPGADWIRGPIDAFIAAKHRQLGLTPVGPAPQDVLLRRVYLDLIGLPPTRRELHAFLADTAPDAYERTVDRLLASPQYGERWGRHWMDVWRYSDTYGLGGQVRNSQKHIWHWRDWVIESLNTDKGYDRMVLEMLAGDEIAPDDPDTLRGTGFLARNYYLFNRSVWLGDIVEHTSKAFLGMTLNCARCHDHKFDPIAQTDYYSFRAFFEPHRVRIDRLPGQADLEKDGIPRVYDAEAKAPTYLFIRGDDLKPDKDRPMKPRVPQLLAFDDLKFQPVTLPIAAYYPSLRPFVIEESLVAARAAVTAAEAALVQAKSAVKTAQAKPAVSGNEASRAAKVDRALRAVAIAESRIEAAKLNANAVAARIEADRAKYPAKPAAEQQTLQQAAGLAERHAKLAQSEVAVLTAADAVAVAQAALEPRDKKTTDALNAAKKKLAAVTKQRDAHKATVVKLGSTYMALGTLYPATSTGRRTALARWITDPRHPLTARVAVNHIWLRHFGEALVPSVFDFGRNGSPPSHPQLLDWLAAEFMSPSNSTNLQNTSGWSMKRLHRAIVTSGVYRLSSSTRGADARTLAGDPDNKFLWRMKPRRMQSQVLRDNVLFVVDELDPRMNGPVLDPAKSATLPRRSLYFRHSRDIRIEFLKLFDDAKVEVVLSRQPTAEELAACHAAFTQLSETAARSKKPDPAARARESIVHVLLNHNDLITVR